MKKLEKCDLCGRKSFEFLFKNKDKMKNIDEEYSLFKCNNCELIFLNPQPTEKDLLKHYPKGYYSFKSKPKPKRLKLLYKTFYSKKGNVFLKVILFPIKTQLRSTKIIPNGKILDVGCGSGDFLLLMKSLGMKCYGIEPGSFNDDFAKYNKLNIKRGSLEEIKFPSNFFDVITLNHVFEHVKSPKEVLKELKRILKPNGDLIIGIPQCDSLAFKIFKENWVQLDTPRHLFIYSPNVLKKYAENTGFKINKMRYNSTPFQFLGSFLYLKNKQLSKNIGFVQNKVFISLLMPIVFVLNLLKVGDQMEITLKKI